MLLSSFQDLSETFITPAQPRVTPNQVSRNPARTGPPQSAPTRVLHSPRSRRFGSVAQAVDRLAEVIALRTYRPCGHHCMRHCVGVDVA